MPTPPKPGKGFDANKYNSASIKAGNKFKRNSKEVVSPGINSIQRGSEKLAKTRIPTAKLKPMAMTYGSSARGKGATKTINRKRA